MTRIMLGIGVFTLAAAVLTAQSDKDRPSLGAIAKAAQEEKAKAEQEKAKTAPTKPESTAPAKAESPAPATTDAKTEKPASRTYTNDDLGRRQPRPLPVYTVDAAAQKPYLTGDRPKDEAYWRSRAAPIRKAIEETNYRSSTAKARLEAIKGNGLDVSAVNGQQSPVAAERRQLTYQVADLEAQLKRYEQMLAALEDEGRRDGALPGWFR